MSGKTERVTINMTPQEKALAAEIASDCGKTLGEYLNHTVRQTIHAAATNCDYIENLMTKHDVIRDQGAEKPCFGAICQCCTQRIPCRTGIYEGVIVFRDQYRADVKPKACDWIQGLQNAYGQEVQTFPQQTVLSSDLNES